MEPLQTVQITKQKQSEVKPRAYLTHLLLDKMAAISQTIFSDAFSWMKRCAFWSKCHWSLFPRVHLTITQHQFRRQAIIWTNADPIHWRMYAALGGDELFGNEKHSELDQVPWVLRAIEDWINPTFQFLIIPAYKDKFYMHRFLVSRRGQNTQTKKIRTGQ